MAKDLTTHTSNAVALPEDLAAFYEQNSNIVEKVSVPTLSPGGKRWTITVGGDKTVLTKTDDDGDVVPLQVARVVILDYAKQRGRAYYPGAYDPDAPAPPTCWSLDSRAAHQKVIDAEEAPFEGFTGKCDTCPMSVKGSKVYDNGKTGTACQQHKMLVVIPAKSPAHPALRLKLAITSVFDGKVGEHEGEGWFAWDHYLDHIRSHGITHTAQIVTKMKFDPNVDWPKVLFGTDEPLSVEKQRAIAPRTISEEVKSLLDGTWTPDGADGKRTDEDEPKAVEAKPAPKAEAKPAPKAPAKTGEVVPLKQPAKAAPTKAAPKAAKAVEPEEDEDETNSPPANSAAEDDLNDLVAEWE